MSLVLTSTTSGKWKRPVSRKFYAYIIERVNSVASLSDGIREARVMQWIDDYMNKCHVSEDLTEMESVVTALLQPMIDQAVERSCRARQCAQRRKEMKRETVTCQQDVQSSDDVTTIADKSMTAVNRKQSREEKRAINRDKARLRRHNKHMERLRRRHQASLTRAPDNQSEHVKS